MITNPILPGFHADPSICRVPSDGGDDYYIATSTFEWWPGVRIHHSRDLQNWRHHSYAVTRKSQLDLLGHPDSAGVWAPCLSYSGGQFWLIYTDVRSTFGAFKDTHNYLITAPSIDGPWSEPIYLNSSGFDPSLFHDDDGRQWLLNQQWIHQPGKHHFNGILLQEYDHEARRLIGPVKNIYAGTPLGVVEGPHLYRRNGWYYLLTAEGGTFYEHAVTLARSRNIDGPYETLPGNPLLTAWQQRTDGLQRSGHASLVQTAHGDWYLAHLCGRPLEWSGPNADRQNGEYVGLHCPLGRETGIQRIHWRDDDWPEIEGGGNAPHLQVAGPGLPEHVFPAEPARDDFDGVTLNHHLNSLRVPFDESWISLTERPGWLRLKGRESLMSLFDQSLVARRQQHFNCRIETRLEFAPELFQQMAGLVAYYNTGNHAYLHVSRDVDSGRRVLRLTVNRDSALSEPATPVVLAEGPVDLAVEFRHDRYQFQFAQANQAGGAWQDVGPALDTAMLSDEAVTRFVDGYARSFGFTGNFIGIACQDLSGQRLAADFDYLSYEARP
ncbi:MULTISPECIES: glycoside hydrolase family 43 protein [unclassified Roseateles]|uniref:glycoside hydrolase family 43 protein n=1 Tax=Pelomonas sp. Root1237 TaxID=1736434 RepID=UPI0006FC9A4D|nr:glycoside hydrolase family 43 protein [Pelomonas sp. Root1237]KQV86028.1 beta-xylosidase [Pelomonas sp. Root1237]